MKQILLLIGLAYAFKTIASMDDPDSLKLISQSSYDRIAIAREQVERLYKKFNTPSREFQTVPSLITQWEKLETSIKPNADKLREEFQTYSKTFETFISSITSSPSVDFTHLNADEVWQNHQHYSTGLWNFIAPIKKLEAKKRLIQKAIDHETSLLFKMAKKLILANNSTAKDDFEKLEGFKKLIKAKKQEILQDCKDRQFHLALQALNESRANLRAAFIKVLQELNPLPAIPVSAGAQLKPLQNPEFQKASLPTVGAPPAPPAPPVSKMYGQASILASNQSKSFSVSLTERQQLKHWSESEVQPPSISNAGLTATDLLLKAITARRPHIETQDQDSVSDEEGWSDDDVNS